MANFNPLRDSAEILCESGTLGMKEFNQIKVVLEDANSPVSNKYLEKLYDSVITKSHVDFDDISESKGDIKKYKGYENMVDVLHNVQKLAQEHKSQSVLDYVKTVQTAIESIERLSDLFEQGFKLKNDYVMVEYNIYVYACVQATSTILGEFVDYIKRPDREIIEITLKNNKNRANVFYIEQLEKFNNVVSKMEYRKYLKALLNKDRENFIGVETMVGMGTVALVAMAIVPVTRELIYQFYSFKSNLSEALAEQAYFLEMNKANVESNSSLTVQKKKEVLRKQEQLREKLLRLSDKLKVKHNMSIDASKKLISNDNKLLTIDRIKRETDSTPLSLL